jgi:hypothetical protein
MRAQPVQQLVGGRQQVGPAQRVGLLVDAEEPARPVAGLQQPVGEEQQPVAGADRERRRAQVRMQAQGGCESRGSQLCQFPAGAQPQRRGRPATRRAGRSPAAPPRTRPPPPPASARPPSHPALPPAPGPRAPARCRTRPEAAAAEPPARTGAAQDALPPGEALPARARQRWLLRADPAGNWFAASCPCSFRSSYSLTSTSGESLHAASESLLTLLATMVRPTTLP